MPCAQHMHTHTRGHACTHTLTYLHASHTSQEHADTHAAISTATNAALAHSKRTVALLYVPAGHCVGLVEPAGQKEPGVHALHWSLVVRPELGEKVPGGQGNSSASMVPLGQKYPAGQEAGPAQPSQQ